MKTSRIIILKTSKRLRHRKNKYLSYLCPPRTHVSFPCPTTGNDSDRPVIFFLREEQDTIAGAVKRHSPASRQATIDFADRLCRGEIDIFGHPLDITDGIDWHLDYPTGRTWPKIPAARVNIVYPHDKSDIKMPWEIARFQFLSALGRAWAYTGNNDYPRTARETIASFISDNRPGIGIHWVNPMEAAIRAANWIVAENFFAGAPGWDTKFRGDVHGMLFEHGRFIRRQLERDGRGINNNHYTANIAGLFILGLYFREIDRGRQWLEFALAELQSEINSQIAWDGMHYENSLGYHRLTFEMFFYTQRLGLLNGFDALQRWSPMLTRMAEFTLAATMPNGLVPNFGDNDDGIWLGGSCRRPDDHRYVPLLAAAAFDRPAANAIIPAFTEIPDDMYWFLGVGAAQTAADGLGIRIPLPEKSGQNARVSIRPGLGGSEIESAPPDHTRSRIFDTSGMVFMRSPDAYVMVSANPVGTGGIGGHKHNDLLSYVFTVGNHEVVIDPGTYAYTAEPAVRNALRGTAAHNTVMVDHAEQNRFYRRQLFWVREDARPEICNWTTNEELDRLRVRHDGYRRLAGKIIHTRHFVFDKVNRLLAVHDELAGRGTHDLLSVVNFGDGTLVPGDSGRFVLRFDDEHTEAAFLTDSGLPWQQGLEPAWRSRRYRQKQAVYRLAQRCRVELPVSWTTVIGIFGHHAADWTRLSEFAAAHFPMNKFDVADFPMMDTTVTENIAVG